MAEYRAPMLIDAFVLTGANHAATIKNIVNYYLAGSGGWNHQRSVQPIRLAFDGAIDGEALIAGCKGKGTRPQLDNAKIVEAVLPQVLGRSTKAFSIPKRTFSISPTIHCSMGPAFFITEGGVVKLIYIHARNGNRAQLSDLAGFAQAVKAKILDEDFFGEPSDIEIHYVDKSGSNRVDEIYDLQRISPYLIEPYEVTLSRFAVALQEVRDSKLAGEIKARASRKSPDASDSEPLLPGLDF